MKVKQSMSDLIQALKENENIAYWQTIPAVEAKSVPFPETVHPKLRETFEKRGIPSLYTHQASSFQAVRNKKDMVAVTPTASGKTLCYNLPVLQAIIEHDQTRALYLFPTKALAQDQKSEMNEIIEEIGISINSYTYDGDTPGNIRQKIRQAGHIVISNPDMLHSSILPHHTKWVSFFENLKYVVIDELHMYRGVFGSHVANVIRRLKRICEFYGSHPIFICTSATIANPKEHAEALTGRSMTLIDNNGAPSVAKHFAFYNPPVVNKPLNIRKSATLEVKDLAQAFLKNGIQTIIFARSRVRVEILLSYLQANVHHGRTEGPQIRGYRGGYLPNQRRDIERGLRNGDILGVVSTNALELGVDIGQLQVCIMTGYPGSVSSTWQQAGRAGRRQSDALILLVASSNPMDQYIVNHPDYFFGRNPEEARINPDNLIILVDHIKCAAYELPFSEQATFDGVEITEICEYLQEEDILHLRNGKWFWMNESFPATNISLRSASQENVVIIDMTEQAHVKVIGEMDRFSAMTLLHEEAIYLHQGMQYQVEKLDWEEKKAYVREIDVNYYTDANLAVQLKVLDVDKDRLQEDLQLAYGEVTVNALPTIFKKIKFETHENIGWGPISIPEEEMHTSATWLSFNSSYVDKYGKNGLETILIGLSHVLKHTAPLFVMCDPVDIDVVPQIKATHNECPTIFIYDKYPGGVGLSEKLYEMMPFLLKEAERMIAQCSCQSGCPSCIGLEEGQSATTKQTILTVLHSIKGSY